jgi:glyoxylase-like metal-dependent hydrolase (beta-lactamase superfamily II)
VTAAFDAVRLLNTGFATTREWILLRGAGLRRVQVPVTVALLHHPEHGWGLFDTGYAPRCHEASRGWPFAIYRHVAPIHAAPDDTVVAQLEAANLSAADVRWIVLSHFHADHVAGLADFPRARLWASRVGWEYARARRGIRALRRGLLPDLLPPELAERITLLDSLDVPLVENLGGAWELFGDGSARLVPLPGHVRGQLGMLARVHDAAGEREVLFAADATWLSTAIRERRPPHAITRVFIDDFGALERTLQRLHDFAAARPDVRIVPTHCPEALARWRQEVGS